MSIDSSEAPDCLKELLESAFLPQLKADLDSIPLEREHFADYNKLIQQRLPYIFDLVQQQHQYLQDNDEILHLLILLLCELTALDTIYHLNDDGLLRNANRLLQQQQDCKSEIDELVFKYYQSKLKKDTWKRQLGAVHGFYRYLEFYYNTNTKRKLDMRLVRFCLSVGLTVRDCHENTYKNMGIRTFLTILQQARPDDLQSLNIHSVIYENVFKDAHFMDSVQATEDIWNCLYNCLNFFENMDNLEWNQVDDMLEILIRNIPLAPNTSISICLLHFVTKLCAYFTLNCEELHQKCNTDLFDLATLKQFHESASANSALNSFRWAKSILDLMVIESYKLMQDANTCELLLQAMHKCYVVCMLPIPLQVLEPHLLVFYDKFTAILMEVIVTQKRQNSVVKHVGALIDTFILHLQRSLYCDESTRLANFLCSFKKLKKHDTFYQK